MSKKIFTIFVIMVVVAIFSGRYYLKGKAPQRQGVLQLKGLQSTVTVKYDNFGVPHIYAQTDEDLYRALGFVHAQDRLFQMELMRRLASGTMAEIFGHELIETDKLFRTLDLQGHAKLWLEQIETHSNPKMLTLADEYLAGVNSFVKTGTKSVEFEILDIPEKTFSRQDIAAIMGFVAFSFAQAVEDDSLVTELSSRLKSKYLEDLGILYTPGFPQLPVQTNHLQLKQISSKISAVIDQLGFANLFHGSNSWLISPQRTESGKAMLVNDPHIGFGQPSIWYEAQLESDNTQVYGHFMGLIPFPLLGFNQKMAWGITMFENDDMDFYREKNNPENSDQYWAIDHWENYQISQQIIKVKGMPDVSMRVKKSRHGPVMNSLLDDSSEDTSLALWWVFLELENQQMEAFYELPFADTLEKAEASVQKIHSPGLNIMYANANGDIAWWATAKLPIRPKHVNSKFVLDGASGNDDILGFYDFSHNPKNINPESGIIYTANNQPADMGDGLIPGYYAPKDRPQRITKMLNKKSKFTVDDMKTMLLDNITPSAKLFQQISLPVLLENEANFSKHEYSAMQLFKIWEGNHDADEVAATIYTRFRIRLMSLIMEDEIGNKLFQNFQHGFLMDRSIWRILPNIESPWWDNVNTDKIETRDELVLQAFLETVEFLRNRHGYDMQNWQWQNDVQMEHRHPLGEVEPLDQLFNVGPFPSNAGVEAVNNLMFVSEGDELKIVMGPSTRRIIDFGDIMNSLGINPTGQSGVVLDKHYDDQALAFANGEFRRQYYSAEDVEQNSEEVLSLIP